MCSPDIFSFIEDPYTEGPKVLDLLLDSTLTFNVPIVTYNPANCQTLTWDVYRTSDDANMQTAMPSTFSISGAVLTITHYQSNIENRKMLYGENNYYFKGTIVDPGY